MSPDKFFWWTFADGYSCCVRGFSGHELFAEVGKHGAVVSVKAAE